VRESLDVIEAIVAAIAAHLDAPQVQLIARQRGRERHTGLLET